MHSYFLPTVHPRIIFFIRGVIKFIYSCFLRIVPLRNANLYIETLKIYIFIRFAYSTLQNCQFLYMDFEFIYSYFLRIFNFYENFFPATIPEIIYRSHYLQAASCRKSLVKKFGKFVGKHPWWRPIVVKLKSEGFHLYQNRPST